MPHPADKGGGMQLVFLHNSFDVHITIDQCFFLNNSGTYGGGLHIRIEHNTSNCHLTVSNTEFIVNHAKLFGGGGADVGFTQSSIQQQTFLQTIQFYLNQCFSRTILLILAVEHRFIHRLLLQFQQSRKTISTSTNVPLRITLPPGELQWTSDLTMLCILVLFLSLVYC